MKRFINILILVLVVSFAFAQDETRTIDSLESVMAKQEGEEKVRTMLQLVEVFYDVSFDDCVNWGERAILLSRELGSKELEAEAVSELGMQYGYHNDLDLAQYYLKQSFILYEQSGDEKKAFDVLWYAAYFDLVLGNMDTALCLYEKALTVAESQNDVLGMAKVNSNKAIIHYQKQEYPQAEVAFDKAREGFAIVNDTFSVARMDANLANLYMEWGKMNKAKKLFKESLAYFEADENYEMLSLVYKNYGQLYVKYLSDFDSAYYYYEKAYRMLGYLEEGGIAVPVSNKVDVLVEMGNVHYRKGKPKEALDLFHEAYKMAEDNSYNSGLMTACVGLASTYSQLAQPSKSQFYIERFFELESKTGITLAHSAMRYPLIVNYARLGRFEDMESEINNLKDDFNAALNENADLYEQNGALAAEVQDLIQKYEFRNQQMDILYSQRNHFRLAFYGLLGIVVFTLAVLVAYKIVRKKRSKT